MPPDGAMSEGAPANPPSGWSRLVSPLRFGVDTIDAAGTGEVHVTPAIYSDARPRPFALDALTRVPPQAVRPESPYRDRSPWM